MRYRLNDITLRLFTAITIVTVLAGCGDRAPLPDAALPGTEQAQSAAAAPVAPSLGSQGTPPPGLPSLPPSAECHLGDGSWSVDKCRLPQGTTTNLPLWARDQTVTPGWSCQEIYAGGIEFKTARPSSASGISITYVPGSASPCGGIAGYAHVVVSPTAPVNQASYGFDNVNTFHECKRFTSICTSPTPNRGVGWSVTAVASPIGTPKPSPAPTPKPSSAPPTCDA